jgi:branched-chain amino acid transport system ATP-binding protein
MSLLSLTDVEINYGGIRAVKSISLAVNEGELVTLIGANGAGKTTTLKAITGLLKPASGTITYNGKNVIGTPAYSLAANGLVMVPEGRGVFPGLTIEENLQMGAYTRNDRAQIKVDIDEKFALFPRLKERAKQTAGTLSGGEQQMLAISRALMARPKLLLLDEPSMGLAPIMVQVSTRGYVMDGGVITISGESKALLANPKVREAYLGEDVAVHSAAAT